ncbi:hypothetical protein FTV88_2489 [Heliorestis convoluta]|uniref:Uncharacterized protein n=1 Tax=Heliorestis convoluta TaxID=356322 RepID=A0A5Q2N5H6_9FIRM|nr:hypothetical protein FTV88_2489 [Heliorestis convoluta]
MRKIFAHPKIVRSMPRGLLPSRKVLFVRERVTITIEN